ncbi:MAG: PAS domain S-box protein [Bacteroidales bacterium]|nr:PAS domain S-box protein [Bacteroidales bacterium]
MESYNNKSKDELIKEIETLKRNVKDLEKNKLKFKKDEEELSLEKNNLKNVFNAMADGIYIVNQQYDIQYVNPVLIKDFGSYEGQKCYEFFHDRTEVCPWCKNADVFEGKTVRWEWYSAKNNRTYDLIDTPLTNPDGSISKLEIFRDITNRKRAEEALKLSNENFQQLVSNITTVIWKADIGKNGAFENTYSSPVLDELLELPPGTMRNDWDKYFSYIKPEYLEQVNKAFKEAIISPGKEINCEYEVLKDTGQTAWFHSNGRCFEKSGKLHVFGSTTDITERKQAEKALKQSELFRRRVFDSSKIPIIVMESTSFKYIDINTAAVKKYGFPSYEASLGKTPLDVSAPVQYDGTPSSQKAVFYIEKALKEGSVTFEWLHRYPNGEFWDAEVHLLSFQSNDKTLIQFSLIDITERKKAEEALRESEARFQKLLENIPTVAVQGYNADGIIHYWNKANELIYGYTAEEAIGKNLVDMIIPSEMKEDVQKLIKHGAKTGEMPPAAELTLMRKDGNPVTVFSSYAVVQQSGKEPLLFCMDMDLTERKQAEELLQKSEAQLRQVIDAVPHMIFAKDRDGRFIIANKAVADGCGTSPENIVGKTHPELLGANTEQYESYLADDREVIDSGKLKFIPEEDYTYPDGHSVVLETTKIPFTSAGIPAVLGVSVDITVRKQAENMLRSSEMLYHSTIDSMDEHINVIDANFRIQLFNAPLTRWCKELGINTDEIIGQSLFEVFPFLDEKKVRDECTQVLETQKPVITHENSILGGKEIITETRKVPAIKDGIVTRIVTIITDITEYKQTIEALRKSEERFRQVTESAEEWVWEVDETALYTYASPIVEKLLGYKPEELVGKKHSFDLFHPDDYEPLKKATFELFAEKKPLFRFLNKNVHKNGNIVWLSTTGLPILDKKGNLLGYRGTDIDITERKKAEEELKKHRDHLEELVKERTKELEKKNKDLEEFNELFIDREFRIKELRDKVKELEAKL